MPGVPRNIDRHLGQFVGAELVQVALGEYQVQFHFQAPGGSRAMAYLGVDGAWEFRDATGAVVDRAVPNAERDAFRLHRLFGRAVVSYAAHPPRSFALRFASGDELWVFAEPDGYESFSIHPGDVFG
jgi:hypothetical protein